jgi:hypothetical protein
MTQTAMLEYSDNGQLNTITKYQPLELPVAAEQPPLGIVYSTDSSITIQFTYMPPSPPPPFLQLSWAGRQSGPII